MEEDSSAGDEGMMGPLKDFDGLAKRLSGYAARRLRLKQSKLSLRKLEDRGQADMEEDELNERAEDRGQADMEEDELNKRAEAFIEKFKEEVRRQSHSRDAANTASNFKHSTLEGDSIEIEAEKRIGELFPQVKHSSFKFSPDELVSLVQTKDILALKRYGGVPGIARGLAVFPDKGVSEYHRPPIIERKHHFGSNLLDVKRDKSFWTFLQEALHDTTLIMLACCAIVSIGLGISAQGWSYGIYEGLVYVLLIVRKVVITAVSYYKHYLFLDLAKLKKNTSVLVTRDGKNKKLFVTDLTVGDVVHLQIGDRVPADGIFIRGNNFLVEQSNLKGENITVDVCAENPFLLSGSIVQDGLGTMLVTSVGKKNEWGKLIMSCRENGEDETPLQVKLNEVAAYFGRIGLTLSLVVFVVLLLSFLMENPIHHPILKWWSRNMLEVLKFYALSVTIFMCSVPEGLPLALMLCLGFAMRRLLNAKVLVRHPSACEAMGSVTCICVDKTGTLTTGDMAVDKIWICSKVIRGSDDADVLKSAIPESLFHTILQSFCLNTSNGEVDEGGKKRISGVPMESALLTYGLFLATSLNAKCWRQQPKKIEHFNSFQKRMSMLIPLPHGGMRALSKGAPDVILKMCDKIVNENGKPISISGLMRENVMDIVHGFSREGLRILCFAYQDIGDVLNNGNIPSDGYTLLAVVGIYNPLCPGVKDAVDACHAAGITLRMVTGDNIDTAKTIAKECGILTEDGMAIEGSNFRSKGTEELKKLLPKIQVLASSSPDDKHKLVTSLKTMLGEVVAVTGDGTNDDLALCEADIRLAMGLTGTEVAKEKADIVIMDDNFATIVNLVKVARDFIIRMENVFQLQLTFSIVALILACLSASIRGSSPSTTIQLIWVNMIADILGALALATELASDNVMEGPPFGKTEFITQDMWSIYWFRVFINCLCLVLNSKGSGSPSLRFLILNLLILLHLAPPRSSMHETAARWGIDIATFLFDPINKGDSDEGDSTSR